MTTNGNGNAPSTKMMYCTSQEAAWMFIGMYWEHIYDWRYVEDDKGNYFVIRVTRPSLEFLDDMKRAALRMQPRQEENLSSRPADAQERRRVDALEAKLADEIGTLVGARHESLPDTPVPSFLLQGPAKEE